MVTAWEMQQNDVQNGKVAGDFQDKILPENSQISETDCKNLEKIVRNRIMQSCMLPCVPIGTLMY